MQAPTARGIVRGYLMSIAFWYGLAVLMGLQYKPLDLHHLGPSLLDLFLQAGSRAFALAFWTPPIFYLVSNYINFSGNRLRYVVAWAFGAVPFIVLHTGIYWLMNPSYDDTLHAYLPRTFHSWFEMARSSFADDTFVYFAIVVAAHAYEYLKRMRSEEAERYKYQQALAASELQALKMQLHPHFLFNTLHGISTLADVDPKTAKGMTLKLSNLLRAALDRSASDLVPLDQELAFIREYLDLEKMRFGERLTLQWQIAPETRSLLTPQMILQPLVENAIRHGIAHSREGGWIEVAANKTGTMLNICVRNSGSGSAPNGTGVGLHNVEARLKYLFGDEASLRVSSDGSVFTANLLLPVLDPRSTAAGGIQTTVEGEVTKCAFSSSTTNP